jgi:hypothetical protein
MCDRSVLVPIPDHVWQAGGIYSFDPSHPEYGLNDQGEKCLSLDACIVPAVKALWAAGVVTLSCCCGHGDPWGVISVQTESSQGRLGAMIVRVEEYDAQLRRIADLERENERLEGWGQNTMVGCLATLVKAEAALVAIHEAVGCGPGASALVDELTEAVRQLSAGKPCSGLEL